MTDTASISARLPLFTALKNQIEDRRASLGPGDHLIGSLYLADLEAGIREAADLIDRLSAPLEGIMMRRSYVEGSADDGGDPSFKPDPNGPYVLWDDAQAALAAEREKRAPLEKYLEEKFKQRDAERRGRKAAEARADRLAEALKPFADEADRYERCRNDRPLVFAQKHEDTTLTVGDLRQARAALAQEKTNER